MDLNRCPNEQAKKRLDCWLQLIRTFERMQGEATAKLAKHSLTLPQFEVLSTLAICACTHQQELAERLQVTKGNLVGLIDRLHDRGWVDRVPDPKDRRVNQVRITASGKKVMDQVFPGQLSVVEAMMEKLSLKEVETLRGLLQKLEKTK